MMFLGECYYCGHEAVVLGEFDYPLPEPLKRVYEVSCLENTCLARYRWGAAVERELVSGGPFGVKQYGDGWWRGLFQPEIEKRFNP